MREAQLLLSNTSLRTYEIAARVGYDNPAYFSTLFKKYTGMTISQYRKAFQKWLLNKIITIDVEMRLNCRAKRGNV